MLAGVGDGEYVSVHARTGYLATQPGPGSYDTARAGIWGTARAGLIGQRSGEAGQDALAAAHDGTAGLPPGIPPVGAAAQESDGSAGLPPVEEAGQTPDPAAGGPPRSSAADRGERE